MAAKHPAGDYDLEATDLLARVMRNTQSKKTDRVLAAAALMIASALKNGKNGASNGK